jgi:hypothetical protein
MVETGGPEPAGGRPASAAAGPGEDARAQPRYTPWMNDNFGELKARVRRLTELLASDGGRALENLELARAVSQAQRILRDGDRTREPSAAARAAVEKAEGLARAARTR